MQKKQHRSPFFLGNSFDRSKEDEYESKQKKEIIVHPEIQRLGSRTNSLSKQGVWFRHRVWHVYVYVTKTISPKSRSNRLGNR